MPEFTGKVLLLANYLPDQQASMQHFAQMLLMGLQARGVAVDLIRPEAKFGRMTRGESGVAKWLGYADKFIAFPPRLKSRLRKFSPGDVLHICDHSSAVYTKHASRAPHIVTCHDLLAVRSALGEIPENPTRATGKIYQRMILSGLNRAQRVACVSKATRNDLQRLATIDPSRITVIEHGLNHPYGPLPRAEAFQRIAKKMNAPPQHFILQVGGNQWYKNRAGVIHIYSEFLKHRPDGPDLILVGKPLPASLKSEIANANLSNRVHALHDCDNEDLRALYSAAEALLFPSLAEGFGWPIIEAQACGCPVVTSKIPPMPDVAGEAAVYVDPRNVANAARTLLDLLWEGGLEKAERKQKSLANATRFSADRMIDRYLEEYALVTAR